MFLATLVHAFVRSRAFLSRALTLRFQTYRAAVSALLFLTFAANVQADEFIHPGLLHTQQDLARLKAAIANKTAPTYQGYQVFSGHSLSKSTYVMQGPFATFGRNPGQHTTEMHNDANAAYQNAVMWAVTGDIAHANKAIQIINGWASTMTAVVGTEQVLCALDGYKLVNAAELLRYTPSGWSAADVARCETWFKTVWYPSFSDFAYYANGNWDAAAIKTVMAVGVFCNDRAIFERGVRYYLDGAGNGRLTHYIINSAGQVQESGRDQGHTELGIGLLSEAAQIGWNQGLDLFSVSDNRLLRGFEYTADYNLGNTVSFTPALDRSGAYGAGGSASNYTTISAIGRGTYRPVFELVLNHYLYRAGLPASAVAFTRQFVEANRPEGMATTADHPGFGTFLFTLTGPSARSAPTSVPAKPVGLYAYGAPAGNIISWAPSRDVASYIIKRSVTSGGPYIAIASGLTSPTYTDVAVAPGQLYYYVVSTTNPVGESPDSLPVSIAAGLPAPLASTDLGAVTLSGRADFDGSLFKLEAGGADIGGTNDQLHYVYAPMVGDGTAMARITLPLSSQQAKVGLMIRETLSANSRHASLLLPVTSKAIWITRNAAGAATTTTGATVVLPAPYVSNGRFNSAYWVKITRKGNVFTGAISPDGTAWTSLDSSTIAMAGNVYVGLAACSRLVGVTTTAAFDHVSLPGFPQTVPTHASVPSITSAVSAASAVGQAFSYTITATNSPTDFSATGLPAGLTLDSHSGLISGNPSLPGNYTVTLSASNSAGSSSLAVNFTITRASAIVTLSGLARVYNGAPQAAVATTTPAALPVTLTYNGSSTVPVNAGTYAVAATISDPSYAGSAEGTLTITKAAATVTLGGLTQSFDGTPKTVSATTVPTGLPLSFTYDGSASAPTNVGSYAVMADVSDSNYTGSASGTLIVTGGTATIQLSHLTQTFTGTPLGVAVTTQPAGLTVDLTYNGSPALPVHAGQYTVAARVNNPGYQGTATATLTIEKKTADLALTGLLQSYDGSPRKVFATTTPGKLTVTVSYDGKATAPVYPGSYAVTATIEDPDYTASVSDTLVVTTTAVVRHAPSLNGALEGSIRVLSPESLTLNGASCVGGDLLVPGTPAVQILGSPNYVSTLNGPGATAPTAYQIALMSGSILRHTVRRIDALTLPDVSAPSLPGGARNVWITPTSKNVGDFKTVRDLTLNGEIGVYTVPPGNYGTFTAHSHGGFSLGVSGATQPAEYAFQNLILTGTSELRILGPVVVTLANGAVFTGLLGNSAHPEWFTLRVVSGGITCNHGATLNGVVIAPHGTVALNDSTLTGRVVCDRLTINGSGSLVDPTP